MEQESLHDYTYKISTNMHAGIDMQPLLFHYLLAIFLILTQI